MRTVLIRKSAQNELPKRHTVEQGSQRTRCGVRVDPLNVNIDQREESTDCERCQRIGGV